MPASNTSWPREANLRAVPEACPGGPYWGWIGRRGRRVLLQRRGVSWPNIIAFYGPGKQLLASIDLADLVHTEHSDAYSMQVEHGDVVVSWQSYQGCCFDKTFWQARLHYDGHQVVADDVHQTTGVVRTGSTIDVTQTSGAAFLSPSGNITCLMYGNGTDRYNSHSVRCDTLSHTYANPASPTCPLDYGSSFNLGATAEIGCVSDAITREADTTYSLGPELPSYTTWFDPGIDPHVHPVGWPGHATSGAGLAYGSVMLDGDLRCSSETTGVTCVNTATHHGFSVSAAAYRIR